MNILGSFRINKAIEIIQLSPARSSPESRQAINKLKDYGEPGIPYLIQALESKQYSEVFESLLALWLNQVTMPQYVKALSSNSALVVSSITRVLAKSHKVDVTQLLELFNSSDISKTALTNILLQHLPELDPPALVNRIDHIDSNHRHVYLRFLEQAASAPMAPSLIARIHNKDPMIRQFIARMLSRFHQESSKDALIKLLEDPQKSVRLAALNGLATLQLDISPQPICQLLKDPDLTVQAKAIETLVQINKPETIEFLIDILQDDLEYVRRAGVEVLNEIGDESSVKDLMKAIKDRDWWVKVRAADALVNIGGPKVVEAVFQLIRDDDEFLRRTAVEILNNTQDERAYTYLLEALEDEDWWVRERAVDALQTMGNKQVVPALLRMLDKHPDSCQIVIRALSSLGDQTVIQPVLKRLHTTDDAVRKEALRALQKLTDVEHLDVVQNEITKLMQSSNEGVRTLAGETVNLLTSRLNPDSHISSDNTLVNTSSGVGRHAVTDPKTPAALPTARFDPLSLTSGTVLIDRYRVIKTIGKGAFGVVVLVDDMVVKEKIILKFLNIAVASDQSMVKRFTKELRYARRISHINVIRNYDFITINHSYAITMEYFSGHSLAYELKQGPIKDITRAVKILRDVCSGIECAHCTNVIHRDLKPANILINDKIEVKIVDFGLAAAASQSDSRITKTGILVGTPSYMAPEQARGQPVDARTDIYSLGIIMYEMTTGKPPYISQDPMSILFKHVEGKPTPPGELNAEIPEIIEAIILKAMAVESADRYQNMPELMAALDAFSSEKIS